MTIIVDECVPKIHNDILKSLGYTVISLAHRNRDTTILHHMLHQKNHNILLTNDVKFAKVCNMLYLLNVLIPQSKVKDTKYIIDELTRVMICSQKKRI